MADHSHSLHTLPFDDRVGDGDADSQSLGYCVVLLMQIRVYLCIGVVRMSNGPVDEKLCREAS